MRETHFTRLGDCTTPDKAGIADGVVRRPVWSDCNQSNITGKNPRHRVNFRGFQRFF